ncbi:alkyl sulfatase dimerization domain-containing protein [Nocardiopsis ansamitocini]|uniref:MBL fold metallo-hydrolase n=1 Tax=Nocardiopsis ansamitocini TaxID=1670832 RepID=A0A9W6P4Q5_9ACTN|nr:alkyl sulfatase dimerization domain-containing protein [Nocardiopsis ansamitocini]GLU47175.1 hypothetical protein Nans01_15260 [Nocardiopsis ansamitocini]
MSYPLSYPYGSGAQPVGREAHRDLEPLHAIRVEDTPAWLLHTVEGRMLRCVVLEGRNGVVLYGTGDGYQQGQAIARCITDQIAKPVRAIVYGENRVDHCSGTSAVLSQLRATGVPVLAAPRWHDTDSARSQALASVIAVRRALQYGPLLREALEGRSPLRRALGGAYPGAPVEPTTTVHTAQEKRYAGLRMRFVATSDRGDSVGVYLPDHRLALVPNEVYSSPSNLIGVEGPHSRISNEWQAMISSVGDLDVAHLVGTRFTPPLHGADRVRAALELYRDGIQYVHDQSIRHMQAGADPDALLELVDIPDHMDFSAFGRPLYGNFVRATTHHYTTYLGWFSGRAAELTPLPRTVRAGRLAQLIGGDRLVEEARAALQNGEAQWSAELAQLALDASPRSPGARRALESALRTLGHAAPNPLLRNYYYSAAMEVSGDIDLEAVRDLIERPEWMTAHAILETLRFRILPEVAAELDVTIGVDLSDTGEHYALRLHNLVLRVLPDLPDTIDARITLAKQHLGELVYGEEDLETLVVWGAVQIDGEVAHVRRFWGAIGPRPALAYQRPVGRLPGTALP